MTAPAAAALLSVEAARDAILAGPRPGRDGADVAAAASLGRVVAEPVTARVSLPPWPNSAMDGYAVLAADTDERHRDDAPIELRVVGDVRAGVAPEVAVGPGTAARIATGARLPPGADAVVPVELTTPLDRGRATRAPAAATRRARCRRPASSTSAVPVGGLGARRRLRSARRRHAARSRLGDDGRGRRARGGGGREPGRGPSPAAGRRCSPPATRCGDPTSRSARPGSPTPTAPGCAPR